MVVPARSNAHQRGTLTMTTRHRIASRRLSSALLLALLAAPSLGAPAPAKARDGLHDFDFNVGTFKTHIRRLPQQLAHSTAWIEWNGVVRAEKVWGGRANVEEIEINDRETHIDG